MAVGVGLEVAVYRIGPSCELDMEAELVPHPSGPSAEYRNLLRIIQLTVVRAGY